MAKIKTQVKIKVTTQTRVRIRRGQHGVSRRVVTHPPLYFMSIEKPLVVCVPSRLPQVPTRHSPIGEGIGGGPSHCYSP